MREIQATDAKARLAELLRAVELGEVVAITRHGKPVAHLVARQRAPAGQPRDGHSTLSRAARRMEARSLLNGRNTGSPS